MAIALCGNMLRVLFRWYMFFEVLSHTDFKGDLGLAYSLDEGRTWAYAGLVMDEPFHLSYPLALRHKGRLYMIPETGEANEIRLYTYAFSHAPCRTVLGPIGQQG
jgi:hypothetical protein